MPSVEYDQALAGLTANFKQAVEGVFVLWSADPGLDQVGQNITAETALAHDVFTSLLNTFATHLAGGKSAVDSWATACRTHKMKGHLLPAADCPLILGRAKGLEDHATAMAKASAGALTSEEVKKLLFKYSGELNASGLDPFLRETPLGKYNLVWATFDSNNPNANPFASLPLSHTGICTALGLGDFDDTLIVLVWNHAHSDSPPLHRPTVADAETYRFYRPRSDAVAPWGLTEPLLPNPDNLQPQPEVVMPDPTSKGLQLPFHVYQV